MQLLTMLQLLKTATYHSFTVGCLSRERPDPVVSNDTIAPAQYLQLNTKFKTASKTFCISRWRPDTIVSNVTTADNCLLIADMEMVAGTAGTLAEPFSQK
jgi:hypothetical protein